MLVALYAFCVLFPVAGFAFGGANAAHCLPDVVQVRHAGPQHEAAQGHAHDQVGHDHANHGDASHDHGAASMADDPGPQHHAGMDHTGSKSGAPACCGVMCVSAMTASVFELTPRVMTPSPMRASSDAGISGEAPDRLYRPPIVLLSL